MKKQVYIYLILFFYFLSFNLFSEELKFKDVTLEAGLSLVDRLGGHGTAVGDINNDGWPDFIVGNSYNPEFIYINNKNGTFSLTSIENNSLTHQVLLVDVDNDGDLDLIISNSGVDEPNKLYINNGNGHFTFKESPLDTSKGNTRGITASDFNENGWLDLYAVNFIFPNQLFINQGNCEFIEEAENRNCQDASPSKSGSQGVISIDVNKDNLPDILISKYKYDTEENQKVLFYINQGNYFIDRAQNLGINVKNTNGATFTDLDNDGDLDLVISKQVSNSYLTIYKNNNGVFVDMTNILEIPLINKSIFSIIPGDVNNDGLEDLFVVGWYSENIMIINQGNWEFKVVNCGVENYIKNGRSASFIDYDNDGDLDILITGYIQHTFLYQNQLDNENKSIEASLTSPNGQKSPYGTKLILYSNSFTNGIPWQTKTLISTQAYLSQQSSSIHFGVGKEENLSLIVKYPTGEEKHLFNLKPCAKINMENVPEINIVNYFRAWDRSLFLKQLIDYFEISIPYNIEVKKIFILRKDKDSLDASYEIVKEIDGNSDKIIVKTENKSYKYAIYCIQENNNPSFVTFLDIENINE